MPASSFGVERGPVLWFSPEEDQTPNAAGFVRAPQRPDDRKFGSSRVLQLNLPPPALSVGSRRPDHRPRQSAAFWLSRAPRRGSLQTTSHATPVFGRVRCLTLQAAQPSRAEGENQHWIKDINGNIAKGRPGMRLNTLPDFFNQVPRTYGKVTNNRLLGSPLLACTLDWDSYLDGTFNEVGGITSGLGRNNAQKNAEPFAFYIFKNAAGRVAFQYKTKHGIILDKDWQGNSPLCSCSCSCLVLYLKTPLFFCAHFLGGRWR